MTKEEEKNKQEVLTEKDKKEGRENPTPKDSPKKPWDLAPRTGQRHANPFQRKTK